LANRLKKVKRELKTCDLDRGELLERQMATAEILKVSPVRPLYAMLTASFREI
jgi:hypothetical protein